MLRSSSVLKLAGFCAQARRDAGRGGLALDRNRCQKEFHARPALASRLLYVASDRASGAGEHQDASRKTREREPERLVEPAPSLQIRTEDLVPAMQIPGPGRSNPRHDERYPTSPGPVFQASSDENLHAPLGPHRIGVESSSGREERAWQLGAVGIEQREVPVLLEMGIPDLADDLDLPPPVDRVQRRVESSARLSDAQGFGTGVRLGTGLGDHLVRLPERELAAIWI